MQIVKKKICKYEVCNDQNIQKLHVFKNFKRKFNQNQKIGNLKEWIIMEKPYQLTEKSNE